MTVTLPEADTVLELSNELLQELKDEIPCDAPDEACLSKHTLPATWVMTHEDATPPCTVLCCEPCALGINEWIKEQSRKTGPDGYECNTCHKKMHERQIIIRRL